MSFCFNPLGNNSMQPMHSLMENVANSNSYLPTLPQMSNMMAPLTALNNKPLEFNLKKTSQSGAGPMDIETIAERDHDRQPSYESGASIEDVRKSVDNQLSESLRDPMIDKNSLMNQNNDILFNNMLNMQPSFVMLPNVMNIMDPSTMLNVQQYSMLEQLNNLQHAPPNATTMDTAISTIFPLKGIITCGNCTLLPPKSSLAGQSKVEKPPGCRTVFVGGLPLNITEEIIREIFERCGEISTLRLSKKHFCHIRFAYEASVNAAMYLSGYRIRVTNSTESTNCGILHVDYAQARDDLYEWECKQRRLQRELRHRERFELDRLRPKSPPITIHYTEMEAISVAEKIKSDETFLKAVNILIAWLERGDCNKRNATAFYSMVQSTNSHLRRLINDKNQLAEELQKAKEHYRKQLQLMVLQFTQIEKVFNAASHKKVWDHFTKAQRKNIDVWKKQTLDLPIPDNNDGRDDDEMDMSDEDREALNVAPKKVKLSLDKNADSKNSAEAASKSDSDNEIEFKNQQIKVLQETICNLQIQLMENKIKEDENLAKISDLEVKLKESNVKQLLLKTKIATAKTPSSKDSEVDEVEENEMLDEKLITSSQKLKYVQRIQNQNVGANASASLTHTAQASNSFINYSEAKIISLIATYLIIHPFGTTYENIWKYTNRAIRNLLPRDFDYVLHRYTNIFVEETASTDVSKNERNWKFGGFNEVTDLDNNNLNDATINTTCNITSNINIMNIKKEDTDNNFLSENK